jgi:hypothetical protein
MTTLAFTGSQAVTRQSSSCNCTRWSPGRVTRPSGDVLGYVEQFRVRAGLRFRAKRFIARQRRFVEMGEFWSMDDAVDCFGF